MAMENEEFQACISSIRKYCNDYIQFGDINSLEQSKELWNKIIANGRCEEATQIFTAEALKELSEINFGLEI